MALLISLVLLILAFTEESDPSELYTRSWGRGRAGFPRKCLFNWVWSLKQREFMFVEYPLYVNSSTRHVKLPLD